MFGVKQLQIKETPQLAYFIFQF